MDAKIIKKLVIAAVVGWFSAFILGLIIGGDLLNAGGMLYSDDEMVQFWLFMSLAPGVLGGVITCYIYEQLSKKDNK